MIDIRDSRGITTFIVRFLLFYAAVPLLFSFPLLPVLPGLTFLFSCGLMGFFTFFQVLIAVTRKFLEKAGWWKPVAIAGAVLSDVAVLWWLGSMLEGALDGSSEWWLVTAWLPYYFVAAFFAWGLREIFHSSSPQETAMPSAPASPAEPDTSENPGESNGADAPTATPASAEADTDKQ